MSVISAGFIRMGGYIYVGVFASIEIYIPARAPQTKDIFHLETK
jgi:hypothetical protein